MKKIFKAIWNQFVYGGHLVSLGPIIIIFIASSLDNFSVNVLYYVLFYIISYEEYLFDRYLGLEADTQENPVRTKYLSSYKNLIPFILVFCFSSTLIIGYSLGINILIISLILQALGLFYSIVGKKYFGRLLGFKNYYIAITFPLVALILAYLNPAHKVSLFVFYIFFCFRLLFSTSFYDIKDIKSDKENGVRTFPVVFSQKKLFYFLLAINWISSLILMVAVLANFAPPISAIYILASCYCTYYLWLWKNNSTDLEKLSNLWCDGEFILWLLIIFVIKL